MDAIKNQLIIIDLKDIWLATHVIYKSAPKHLKSSNFSAPNTQIYLNWKTCNTGFFEKFWKVLRCIFESSIANELEWYGIIDNPHFKFKSRTLFENCEIKKYCCSICTFYEVSQHHESNCNFESKMRELYFNHDERCIAINRKNNYIDKFL